MKLKSFNAACRLLHAASESEILLRVCAYGGDPRYGAE